ncbi:TraQ conjugal transfer family protein [Alistipes ihumii]|uniref:TraQ conjugal transfer family protein n=1 Tax=Alistipes ihumii TaxID=1470347 RepID=UPI003FEE0F7A
MLKTIIAGCTAILSLLVLGACDDTIHVQQKYGFALSTWYFPQTIRQGEAVEIRFTLTREGYFTGAEYFISYVQTEGSGEVCDTGGALLISREYYALRDIPGIENGVFTLFYTSLSDRPSRLKFTVTDNFGQMQELEIEFQNGNGMNNLIH